MPALSERIKTYSGEAKVENEELNRIQDDGLLNSDQLEGLNQDLHYPHVATSDNKLAYTTAADKVTITGSQVFSVGGIRFDTSDLANLEQTIPDSFDGYLRVAVASDCGDVVDAGADPIVRKLTVTFSQTTGSESDAEGTGGGPSSPLSARLFHITKGAGGSTPTVTAYANTGHSHVSSSPTAADVSYDNTTSGLTAADVQEALDEVGGRLDTAESDMDDKAESNWVTKQTLVSGGSATTLTTVDASAYIGSDAREVILEVERTGTTAFTAYFAVPGGVEIAHRVHESSSGWIVQVHIGVNSSGEFQYRISIGTGNVIIRLVGWR